MRIGIITFHWATNYGAVIQAYALSEYLKSLGHSVEIIDYYPPRLKKNFINVFKTRKLSAIPKRIREISKEKNIMPFRQKYLTMTKYFKSNKEMMNSEFEFDCYICGSDQIWNESFLSSGERKRTYSYFLNFAEDDKIIASYAASFGVTKYRDDLKSDIQRHLKRFDFISVRENTGLNILKDIGIDNACVVPDPTMLLQKKNYEELVCDNMHKGDYAFVYMIHNKDKDAEDLIKYTEEKGDDIVVCDGIGINEWLSEIYYAKHVITNSFHGVVFSVIFEKPFTAVLIKDSGMNDRIITLLDYLGLSDRIYKGNAEIIEQSIDWDKVSEKLSRYREIGFDYINKILNHKKEVKR